MLIGRLSAEETQAAAENLHRLPALAILPEQSRYALSDAARHHIRLQASCPEIQAVIRSMLERLSGLLLGAPDAAVIALHLLSLREVLPLSLPDCVRIIETAWPAIRRQGMWQPWSPVLKALLQECEQAGVWQAASLLHYWSGIADRELAHYEEAETSLLEVLRLGDRSQTSPEYAQALIELAVVYRYQERRETARSTARFARSICTQLHDLAGIERANHELIQLALDDAAPEEALGLLASVEPTARAASLACQAQLLLGNNTEALALARRAIDLAAADRPNLARAQAALGHVYLAMVELKLAEEHLVQALRLLEETGDLRARNRAAGNLARVFQLQGRPDEAASLLEATVQQQRALGDRQGLVATLQTLLTIYLAQADRALEAGDDDAAARLAAAIRQMDEEWRALLAHRACRADGKREA